MVIVQKNGKEHVDVIALLTAKAEVEPGEAGKTAWVLVGYPLFMWPLTLLVLIFGGITLAWLGS